MDTTVIIFAEYNQQDATFHNLFIYFFKTLYMFQTVFRPSSGAQNCTYSVRHLSDQYWPGQASSRWQYWSDTVCAVLSS